MGELFYMFLEYSLISIILGFPIMVVAELILTMSAALGMISRPSPEAMIILYLTICVVLHIALILLNTLCGHWQMLDNRTEHKWKEVKYRDIKDIVKKHLKNQSENFWIQEKGVYYTCEATETSNDTEVIANEFYTKDRIYDHGIDYVLSYPDYLRYRRLLEKFVEKMEKRKQIEEKRREMKQKEDAIQKNMVL